MEKGQKSDVSKADEPAKLSGEEKAIVLGTWTIYAQSYFQSWQQTLMSGAGRISMKFECMSEGEMTVNISLTVILRNT